MKGACRNPAHIYSNCINIVRQHKNSRHENTDIELINDELDHVESRT